MSLLKYVAVSAAIVALCVLDGCGRQHASARKAASVRHAEFIEDMNEAVNTLGDEPATYYPTASGGAYVSFAPSKGVVALVRYAAEKSPPVPTVVVFGTERHGPFRVSQDGACVPTTARIGARCPAFVSRDEWKLLFENVAGFARMSGKVPGADASPE